jgi:hypothetical protein
MNLAATILDWFIDTMHCWEKPGLAVQRRHLPDLGLPNTGLIAYREIVERDRATVALVLSRSIPIIGDGDTGFADGGANNRLGDYHRRGGYRVTIGRGEDRQNTSSVVTG